MKINAKIELTKRSGSDLLCLAVVGPVPHLLQLVVVTVVELPVF